MDVCTYGVKFYTCLLLPFSGELIFTQYIEEFRKVFPGRGGKLNGNDKHNDHEILFGSTMGLYIAAEIVKKMGGDVTIASALGHGTEINVSPVDRSLRLCAVCFLFGAGFIYV